VCGWFGVWMVKRRVQSMDTRVAEVPTTRVAVCVAARARTGTSSGNKEGHEQRAPLHFKELCRALYRRLPPCTLCVSPHVRCIPPRVSPAAYHFAYPPPCSASS
jgi:hypothetical protein